MQPAAPQPGQTLVQIGAISANDHWIVTPVGTWKTSEVSVVSTDQTATTTHTPAWAIVLVILFIWFLLLSLLFLLARERRISGFVSVQVLGPNGQVHAQQIPVASDAARWDVLNRVNYLQSLIGHARGVESSGGSAT